MKHRVWICLILGLFMRTAQAFPGATQSFREDHIEVQILSSERSLRPGHTQTFALRFQLDPHWHVYWKNPGDSGQPPELQWRQPAAWIPGGFQWPAPARIPVGPFYNFGYEGEVILPFSVSVPQHLDAHDLDLEVLVKWLVCEEECIPGQRLFQWSMPIHRGTAAQASDWEPIIQKAQSLASEGVLEADLLRADADTMTLRLDAKRLAAIQRVLEFFPDEGTGLKATPPVISGFDITVQKNTETPAKAVSGLVVLAKQDGQRLNYEVTMSRASPSSEGWWSLLLLAFAGGLILNVMPCVLPVLAIKVLSLVRESGADQRKVRLGSLAYGAGVLLSFIGLAGLLLLLKAGGEAVGWGFQLQSPVFIATLALLFFLMALNFLDLIQPWNAFTRLGQAGAHQSGFGGHFLSGVLAVTVASPCTGPFMGVAVGSALTRSAAESLLIFACIGLGFLSPFLALAWIPGSRRLLPKPGRWMETFRQSLAFPLLLTLLWLVWVLERQTGINGVLWLLGAFVALGFCAWLWLQMKSRHPRSSWLVALLMLAICVVAIQKQKSAALAFKRMATQEAASSIWQPFSMEKLAQARLQGPVFVDFTAAWCVTCQVNKTLVLDRDDVQKAFAEQGIRLFRADWTDYNPEITRMLANLGRQGVPVYALYRDSMAEPRLLPEVLTPDLLLKEISR